ncbi:non-ribosomal peptide synthetase [Bacillus thuringiensis]|uniref:non-ribosomal peptide synthetase n=1 Tax=Bacillus thuringiensis TaxID=1428 RepID=UPI000BF81E18|nr:non-ribosomal peptide synthetase [Bacillus thuringiensis]PFJ51514.1 hypothetical protein COJ02_24685 [Bacillus thuringiensis]PFR39100.1 hypothetical protein COK27_18985 [Bacillus thuringiensis]PGL28063.1 hypothetical protein CN921_05370 [Bacillus thuringiensis]
MSYNNYEDNILITSMNYEAEEKFWINKLGGKWDESCFPVDFNITNEEEYTKAIYSSVLSYNVFKKIISIGNNSEYAIFTILLSGIKYLLSRYCNSGKVLMGTPPFLQEDESSILNNIMFLNDNVNMEISFGEFLKEVKNEIVEVDRNQHIPFTKLLTIVSDSSSTLIEDETQLIETIVLMENVQNENSLDNLKPKILFRFNLQDENIFVTVEYNSKLYLRETIKNIVIHLNEFYKKALTNPQIKLKDVDMMNNLEKEILLKNGEGSTVYYPKGVTIHQLFEERAKEIFNKTVLCFKEQRLSYGSLNNRANYLAVKLREQGIEREDVVGIMLDPSFYMFIGVVGILKSGGAYLPIDPEYPQDRISYMLEDSGAKILITQRHLEDKIEFEGKVIFIDEEEFVENDEIELENVNTSTDLAYVIYTSGSTGKPKGVMIEHKALVNLCFWHKSYYDVSENDRVTKYAGFGFDASVWEMFPYIIAGAEVHIIDESVRLDIYKLNQYFENNKITISFLPTQICEQFIKLENKSLRKLLTGGDRLRNFKKNNYDIINNYGPTENTVVTSSFIVDKCYRKIPIGKPIYNVQAYVLDKNNGLQLLGLPGELCISGDGLARGYINNDKVNSEKFIENPFKIGQKMYRTGDIVRWLPNGNLEFLGRRDAQVKVRGNRVELGEIENIVMQYKGIKNCVITAKDNGSGNLMLFLYYVTEIKINVADLKEFLSKSLPKYMIPNIFIPISYLPLTANGKVDREKLPKVDECAISVVSEYKEAKTATEKVLVSIWSNVLESDEFGTRENFFDIGGNSLLLIMMHTEIEKKYKDKITVADIFANPTIEKLAEFIDLHESEQRIEIPVNGIKLPMEYYIVAEKMKEQSRFNFSIDRDDYIKIMEVCNNDKTELKYLLLSLYIYILMKISDGENIEVQVYGVDEEIYSLPVNLENIDVLDKLIEDVKTYMENMNHERLYKVKKARMIESIENRDKIIVPLFNFNTNINSEFKKFFDIILKATINDFSIELSFEYNNDKINYLKAKSLFNKYANIIDQILK